MTHACTAVSDECNGMQCRGCPASACNEAGMNRALRLSSPGASYAAMLLHCRPRTTAHDAGRRADTVGGPAGLNQRRQSSRGALPSALPGLGAVGAFNAQPTLTYEQRASEPAGQSMQVPACSMEAHRCL